MPLINHYLINEIVLFSGFEFCWQLSYERLISICVFLIVIVLINVDVIMNESVRVVIILGGVVVVEDAVVAIISYEIGICHLFSGLKIDVHCEGKPVR